MEKVEITVARLDERTKLMLEMLEDHCGKPSCEVCKLSVDVARLKTNVSWINRIGSSFILTVGSIFGIKGF